MEVDTISLVIYKKRNFAGIFLNLCRSILCSKIQGRGHTQLARVVDPFLLNINYNFIVDNIDTRPWDMYVFNTISLKYILMYALSLKVSSYRI